MDSLAIQRSLTILEDRYRELREIGEKHFEAWDSEKADLKQQLAAQAEALQQTQQARDEQAARVQLLEGELVKLTSERDAAAMEKAAAQQSVTDLKQQLAAQAEALQQEKQARQEAETSLAEAEAALRAVSGRLRQLVQH